MAASLPVAPAETSGAALRVFISGTQDDLQEERDAAEAAVRRLGYTPTRAENAGSQSRPSREAILKLVSDCDIYLGVFGPRYGWKVADLNVSATELEYEEAQRLNKPTLIYVKRVDHCEPEQEALLKRIEHFDKGFFRRPKFDSPGPIVRVGLAGPASAGQRVLPRPRRRQACPACEVLCGGDPRAL
jgi:hypothetical protein